MDLNRPLTLVAPTVDADVLAVLASAEAEFTGRQVHQVAGRHSEKGVRNALHRLVGRHRQLPARWQGGPVLPQPGPLAGPHVVALAALRHELLARISAELAGWEQAPVFAASFGSAATGRMRPDSDIDLLVVRPEMLDVEDPRWRGQLDGLSTEVTAWTGNDTRVLEMGEAEVQRGSDSDEPVLADVRAEGIVLFGQAAYLSAGPRRSRARRG